ncbi:P2Y purinoceptor 13-like [Gouania willdenowi]|uniref:P2Y purinoceptor 13-like n=1 Tax=Gouania willdenowi TaxID=441366 RepID=UPI001056AC2C|nr:P2Y purinoceptor 13-like [Gouania willdenowi]
MDERHVKNLMSFTLTYDDDFECDRSSLNPYVIPALYFLMLPIALVLNGVAAWVSLYLKSTSTFVIYLKNLVVADLIMAFLIPIKVANDLTGSSNTSFILSCRFFGVILYNIQYTCIALLGFISLDRFFKIVTPRNMLFCQNVTFGRVVSTLIWVIIFGCTGLPNIILTNKSPGNMTEIHDCMYLKTPAGLVYHTNTVICSSVFFWLVSVVVVVCYICIARKVIQSFRNSGSNNNRGNQKIKLRVFLVVVVFFVSFLPYHAIRIPYTFRQINFSSHNCSYVVGFFTKELSLWLATTNICMNPLLYVFLSREFKEKLKTMTENVFVSLKTASVNKGNRPLSH